MWYPGSWRGGVVGCPCQACPSWPAVHHPLRPNPSSWPRLQEEALCSEHSAPYVPRPSLKSRGGCSTTSHIDGACAKGGGGGGGKNS